MTTLYSSYSPSITSQLPIHSSNTNYAIVQHEHALNTQQKTTMMASSEKNPFKNQIDYIIVKSHFKHFITNSRSHGGCKTNTDHKLVRATSTTTWTKLKKQKQEPNHYININKFSQIKFQKNYKQKTKELHQKQKTNFETTQKKGIT